MSTKEYAFGDSDIAASRLRLLAELMGPEMRSFLRTWAPAEPVIAVDLGCGPGFTTRLVDEELNPAVMMGIDGSTRFIELAREFGEPGTWFVEGDLSSGGVPRNDVDVLFVHLLLAHLRDPRRAVVAWMEALAPHGRLLIDEVESIEVTTPLLAEYFALAEHVVAHRGATMNAGSVVAGFGAIPGVNVVSSVVVEHSVAVSEAVEMFILNFRTIRGDASLREDYDALDAMANGLRQLRSAPASERVVWRMRQVVLERA